MALLEYTGGFREQKRVETYRITRLLSEDLSKLDCICVVVEFFPKIDHLVSRILLFARACSGEEGSECCNGHRVTLLGTTGCDLDGGMRFFFTVS